MARIKQGFLGNASGKLGNVVFSKWRDLQTARQYQPDVKDANSPSQQIQRSRMISLLQFLKPLNNNFIKFFNAPEAKGTTAWAKAIKDNMPAVGSDGYIIPKDFKLGNPNHPPFDITNIIYDPFIDCCSFSYAKKDLSERNDPFPYIATSVLGVHLLESGKPEFDTRHKVAYLPPERFFCSFYENPSEHTFDNYWAGTWVWFIYHDMLNNQKCFNPNNYLTEPQFLEPIPIIDGFNTDIKDNPVPLSAFHWEYVNRDNKWYLDVAIDFSKTKIDNPENYKLTFWGVGLYDNKHEQYGPYDWRLNETSKEFELKVSGYSGSFIGLYALYTNDGEQVGRYNRLYVDKGTNAIVYPYYEQLFNCAYAHPVSFTLPDNQCGFCGSVNELFSDFIQQYEQGLIFFEEEPVSPIEMVLNISASTGGTVSAEGFTHIVNTSYYYNSGTNALINVSPVEGFTFFKWEGVDAADVIQTGEGIYNLLMSKDRAIAPLFRLLE